MRLALRGMQKNCFANDARRRGIEKFSWGIEKASHIVVHIETESSRRIGLAREMPGGKAACVGLRGGGGGATDQP